MFLIIQDLFLNHLFHLVKYHPLHLVSLLYSDLIFKVIVKITTHVMKLLVIYHKNLHIIQRKWKSLK
jgi:hypothetical protein